MDDLGQLIFVVLIILFGLISSSKKKPRTKPRMQTPPNEPTSASETQIRSRAPAEVLYPSQRQTSERAEEAVQPKSSLARELMALLEGEVPAEGNTAVTLPEIDDEAQSVETLEPAGAESHKRFHELYMEDAPVENVSSQQEQGNARPYAVIEETPVRRSHRVNEKTTRRPYDILAGAKRNKHLSRRELQHAFVMKEVLGPPKALE